MAARRNILGIFKECEGLYPKCIGTQTLNGLPQYGDENLRQLLPSFANKFLDEFDEAQRWRRNFQTVNFVTTPGTAYYPSVLTPNSIVYIHKAYWVLNTGRVVPLELMDQQEPRAVYGEGTVPPTSMPRYYSILGDTLELFPAPDANGPTGGNYTIYLDCYTRIPKVVPGTCQTFGNTTVTVPSGTYYGDHGLDPANVAGNYLSIRGAANDSGISGPNEFSDYTEKWTNLVANNFTMASATAQTLAAGTPIFINSVNWVLDIRPQTVLYGILRQIASYLQANQDYQMWEVRYQKEMSDLMDWDSQFRHDNEVYASAERGQQEAQLSDINYPNWGGQYWW